MPQKMFFGYGLVGYGLVHGWVSDQILLGFRMLFPMVDGNGKKLLGFTWQKQRAHAGQQWEVFLESVMFCIPSGW